MNRFLLSIACILFAEVGLADFSNNVRLYQGDLNSDLRTDFFVQQRGLVILHGNVATPISIPSSVSDFVLVQTSNGDFSIASSLTNAEQETVEAWPRSSADLYIEDLNIDGRIDLMMKDLSSVADLANDSLEDEHIVFGPTGTNSVPTATRQVDSELSHFMTDLNVYQVQGLEYYFNASTYVGEQCIAGFVYPIYFQDILVGWTFICIEETSVYDLSDFSQAAIDAILEAYDVYDGIGTMADIVEIFEQIFGVQIGIPGLPDCGDSFVAFPNAQDCKDNETLLNVLLRFANARETPLQGEVEFRAQPVAFGRGGYYHASVHYGNQYYSAFPENGPWQAVIGNGGKLKKERQHPDDHRSLTRLAASVENPILSADATWNLIRAAYAAYSNNLDYCIHPELGRTGTFIVTEWPAAIPSVINPPKYVPCDGYNSNSFAKGLVNMAGAILYPTVQHDPGHGPFGAIEWEFDLTSADNFPGITKPVPPSEFQ